MLRLAVQNVKVEKPNPPAPPQGAMVDTHHSAEGRIMDAGCRANSSVVVGTVST